METLKTQLQHRVAYQPSGLGLREVGDEEKKNTIDGVAIVVEQETVLWEGSDYREVEVIAASCIEESFVKTQDIKLNLLHERSMSFARTGGTLLLDTREDGLHFECPVPDCDLGIRAKALIENGTYTGCSFEFWPKDYEVSERKALDGKTEYVIRHTAFERIGAITIGMDPAYEQTSVNAREIFREQHPEEPAQDPVSEEQKDTEQEEREKAEKETRERRMRELQGEVTDDELMASRDALC